MKASNMLVLSGLYQVSRLSGRHILLTYNEALTQRSVFNTVTAL